MVELRKREEDLGFRLMSIEVSGKLEMVREVVKEEGVDFPVLIDSESYSREALHVMGTPTTFVIDEKGIIRCRLVGYISDLEGTIEDVIGRI
jgi:hypothetical protein